MTIKILIADDHQIVREGLISMLSREGDLEVIAEVCNGREAVRRAIELEPDVVVMDIAMPDLNGVEATRQLLEVQPGVRVVALSMHSDRRYVMETLRVGGKGYLLKGQGFMDLAAAIRAVAAGRVYLSPEVASVLVEAVLGKQARSGSSFDLLSPREREVLQLIAEGHTNKEIADKLNLSVKTVQSHRASLMGKLNIRNVAHLTRYAIREGLTPLD